MKTVIIIGCAIVYFIMWVVTGVIAKRVGANSDEDFVGFVGFFWPITLPVIGMHILIDYTDWWLDHREDKE